jgi:hypothetical protein
MRLWTIQDKPAYRRLLDKGVLYGDWRRVDDRLFKPAYRWLCWQMELRGISLKKRCPMWAWTHKPDMRREAHNYRGKHGVVRLELEVPDDLVLLSNFDAWHFVLNDCFCILTDEEFEKCYSDPGYSREEVTESWERIFDLKLCESRRYFDDWTQATFPTIELDYVKKACEFAPRNR